MLREGLGGKVHFRPLVADELQYAPDTETPLNVYVYGLQGVGYGDAPSIPSLKSFWLVTIMALVKELCNKALLQADAELSAG